MRQAPAGKSTILYAGTGKRNRCGLSPDSQWSTLTDISAILRNKYDIGLLRIFRALNQERRFPPGLS